MKVQRLEWIRRERVAILIISLLVLAALGLIAASLSRPEPPSFPVANDAILIDAAQRTRRLTIDASDPVAWRFLSLREGRVLAQPGPLAWDLAVRRFHIATNGGPGLAGSGAAGVVAAMDQPPALQQTSADTTKSGFGKWYDYGFTSHLLTPKPLTYSVLAADGSRYTVRILSYYCPGAQPGCITIEYSPQ
ncbi:MAG: HmuY family protein [Longimicrobiales bacterium]